MRRHFTAISLALLTTAPSGFAQAPADTQSAARADTAAQSPAPPRPLVPSFRWVEPFTLNGGLLYQSQYDDRGTSTLAQLRGQFQLGARLRLEKRGRFTISAAASTGASFKSGWNHTPIGSQAAASRVYVKQVFATATPVPAVQVQVGSFAPYRGQATEMTSFDNDGYISGARILLKAPARLWFQELAVTRAYLGDLQHPSAFDRLHRLDEANYGQLAAVRRVGTTSMSVEIADYPAMTTLGGALQTRAVPGLSAVRLELTRSFAGDATLAVAAAASAGLARSSSRSARALGCSQASPATASAGSERQLPPPLPLPQKRWPTYRASRRDGAWRPSARSRRSGGIR